MTKHAYSTVLIDVPYRLNYIVCPLHLFFVYSQMETDCLLVNTSFEILKCLQQNYLFFPIKATCSCTLSQFAMSTGRAGGACLPHCVSTTSAAVAEMFQSKQNQAAHYSLLGLSVTSKDLPAVSKPLGSKLLGSGERQICLKHARKFVDK